MKLEHLINNARSAQYNYFHGLSDEEIALKITSYIMEELVEVNRELNHIYKPFKAEKEIDYGALKEEIADIFIYWTGLAAVIASGGEMEQIISDKLEKNKQREDHVRKPS